jgi:aspartate aminotransferase
MKLAERMHRLGTESAFEVAARARALEAQGRPMIHLEIGEPDFETPGHIRRAACEALEAGYTHYGPAVGLPELRETLARHISEKRGITADPERIIVTPGAKPIMFYAILALIEPGDQVIYPNPGFPIYESMINFIGGEAVPLQLTESRGFSFDIADLQALISDRTRMIILNSPQNPTGGVLSRETLRGIADLAIKHDLVVLADEIYSDLLYEGTHHSILEFPGMLDRTILLDGFSKTYAMTGWRMGYGLFPAPLIPHVSRLIINSVSCTSSFSQMAAVAAINGPQDEVKQMLTQFRQRRELVIGRLNDIAGLRCVMPHGAFYAFPNILGTGMDSRSYADYLLTTADVAVLPGTAFGQFGEGYIRISFANSMENLSEALDRIERANARLMK